MPGLRTLSRRTTVAGLGAGSLGLFVSRRAGATGPRYGSLADHPLTGFWLALMALPTNPDEEVAVPGIFGADGSVVFIFPCTEKRDDDVQLNGAAIGVWEAIDDRRAHFTTIHSPADLNGLFQGTVTLDGYPYVNDDNETFDVDSNYDVYTVRDYLHQIVTTSPGPHKNPMRGYRMHPGNIGFPEFSIDPADIDNPIRPR